MSLVHSVHSFGIKLHCFLWQITSCNHET